MRPTPEPAPRRRRPIRDLGLVAFVALVGLCWWMTQAVGAPAMDRSLMHVPGPAGITPVVPGPTTSAMSIAVAPFIIRSDISDGGTLEERRWTLWTPFFERVLEVEDHRPAPFVYTVF